MPAAGKGIANDPGTFAAYKHTHKNSLELSCSWRKGPADRAVGAEIEFRPRFDFFAGAAALIARSREFSRLLAGAPRPKNFAPPVAENRQLAGVVPLPHLATDGATAPRIIFVVKRE